MHTTTILLTRQSGLEIMIGHSLLKEIASVSVWLLVTDANYPGYITVFSVVVK